MSKHYKHPHPAPEYGTKEAIPDEIAKSKYWLADQAPSTEIAISPMKVPMRINDNGGFDSLRLSNGATYPHKALDGVPAELTAEPEVVAATSGRVVYAGNLDPNSGYTVFVFGVDWRIRSYAHLKKWEIDPVTGKSIAPMAGQIVKQGDTLGIMGNTGNAEKNPCLHYKVREPKQGFGLLPASDKAAPGEVVEAPSLDTQYKIVPPTVNGVELHIGDVVQPGIPPTMHQQIADELHKDFIADMRRTTGATLFSSDDIVLPQMQRVVFEQRSPSPKSRNR